MVSITLFTTPESSNSCFTAAAKSQYFQYYVTDTLYDLRVEWAVSLVMILMDWTTSDSCD